LTVSRPEVSGSCMTVQDSVRISIYNPSVLPQDAAGADQTICQGDTISLGMAGTNGIAYNWTPSSNLSNAQSPQPSTWPDGPVSYVLATTDPSVNGPCGTLNDTVAITVEQPFTHPLPAPVVTFCPGECILLGVAPQPGFDYAWAPTTGLDAPNASMTRARPDGTTTYTLTVTDPGLQSSNCRRQVYTVVATADNCHFPTLLWPNGDGIAETLDFGEYAARVELTVYDLQGRRVYVSEDYGNDWRGEELAVGVYGYRMTVTGECGFARAGKFLKMR
ncbi:MAG: gliding motility-associated C-terminal domain-containing protein, partial [Bacteroidota bacterium]